MSGSGLTPNGSRSTEELDEFARLSAELEKLGGALSKLEENSDAFNSNAKSLLVEIKQIREENRQDSQQTEDEGNPNPKVK